MAVQRRGYIFGAFLLSVLCVLLVVVGISSDSWVVCTTVADSSALDGNFRYGLFRGEILVYGLATPNIHTMYMTCIVELNACAVSCKTEEDARQMEVRALAQGFQPRADCISSTDVDESHQSDNPPVISFAFYVSLLVILFLQLTFGVLSAALAIINATKNPTEPVFGLPGCLWANVVTAILGVVSLFMFGINWTASGLSDHLAVSYIAFGYFTPIASLGFSYWLLIPATLCPIANVGLIQSRSYLLEKDPPPPTIKLENHSDGTIFLY
ncbi:unnamed protein product [Arctia plantaginis]|uniref:Uncharacterized protein n=1 Tax=Arctia plantaginis TaxID=874455 RepID=A0A8S0YUJ7_ARCPL|nr:unnamed protein product [Arctia plantaginis]CAB3227516.1 unnamed protein product [Arctia plantaginis]